MSSKRILIVEDEFIIAQNLTQILVELGYVVSGHAFDAAEALEILQKGQTDLALLDINLGAGMDGIALAAEIRRDFALPFISSLMVKFWASTDFIVSSSMLKTCAASSVF